MSSRERDRGAALAAVMRDPVVPLDFGNWWRRVFGVFRRNFGRLAALAVVPVALAGVYLIIVSALTPDPAEVGQRLSAAAAASPTGTVSPSVVFWTLFGPTLPVMVIFLVLMAVVTAFYYGAAFYLALREANGQPTDTVDALRVAAPRVLPFVGWGVLAGLIVGVAVVVPVLPGVIAQLPALSVAGSVVALVLFVGLGVVFYSSISGVVLIERAGIGRCFRLVRGRFWATCGRMVVVVLLCVAYDLVLLLVAALIALPFGGIQRVGGAGGAVVHLVELVLTVPELVFVAAVALVTYAELRFHQDPSTSTRTLLADLSR